MPKPKPTALSPPRIPHTPKVALLGEDGVQDAGASYLGIKMENLELV